MLRHGRTTAPARCCGCPAAPPSVRFPPVATILRVIEEDGLRGGGLRDLSDANSACPWCMAKRRLPGGSDPTTGLAGCQWRCRFPATVASVFKLNRKRKTNAGVPPHPRRRRIPPKKDNWIRKWCQDVCCAVFCFQGGVVQRRTLARFQGVEPIGCYPIGG